MTDDGLRQIAGVKGRSLSTNEVCRISVDEVDAFVVLRRPVDDVVMSPAQATRLASDLLHLSTRVAQRAAD